MRSGKEGTGGARTRRLGAERTGWESRGRLGVLRIEMEGTEHGKARS